MANGNPEPNPQSLQWMRRLQRARHFSRGQNEPQGMRGVQGNAPGTPDEEPMRQRGLRRTVGSRTSETVGIQGATSAAMMATQARVAAMQQASASQEEAQAASGEEQGAEEEAQDEGAQASAAAEEEQREGDEAQMLQQELAAQRQAELEELQRQQEVASRRLRLALIFPVMLILAIAKDFLDILSAQALSWIDWILDFIIGAVFFIAYSQGAGELRATANLVRRVAPMILEAIPIIGVVPIWTISVILMTISNSQEDTEGRVKALAEKGRQKQLARMREGVQGRRAA